ncbi:MAG: CocE/NonD family hydrolase [Alphaproteobacteria bacterium]|nr:CocE/NonD family hydrolase [Alphaproteobacteria bacterium]
MVARNDFPRAIEAIENVFVPLPDGCRLAARMWLPCDARVNPVPAILEYIPYRKRDHYRAADELTHPYFAGHGYACLRVDLRGAGDSDGLLLDEYLDQEQEDAVHLLDWIASQPWCNGNVGMMGLSWGGFNGLQVAARQPKPLKAVVTIGSSDDRYSDDVHYMGGCLLTRNLGWAAYMLAFGNQAPDPEIVGPGWREAWLSRLRNGTDWFSPWFRHQRRDAYWRRASVCEDYDAIECPVYAVGGWPDAYTNTVMRLLANLKAPCKGLIGPWGHDYPHVAGPAPAIGWLQETLRWWDRWLKGIDNGIMDEPRLTVWMQDGERPSIHCTPKSGRWAAEAAWPSPRIATVPFRIVGDAIVRESSPVPAVPTVLIASPLTVGLRSGAWCSYGAMPDLPGDQREEDAGSRCFDTAPLAAPFALLGTPTLKLRVMVDRPLAFLAVRLCDVWPDGASTRVSYGLLNLAHHAGDDRPTILKPGCAYDVTVRLNDTGYVFPVGNRVRVAISTAYWPTIWPSPEVATVTLDSAMVELLLPERPPRPEDASIIFSPPEHSGPAAVERVRPRERRVVLESDLMDDTWRQISRGGFTVRYVDTGTTESFSSEETMAIRLHDPLSARHDIAWTMRLARGDWRTQVDLEISMTSTATDIAIDARVSALEGNTRIFTRGWAETFPRDHL